MKTKVFCKNGVWFMGEVSDDFKTARNLFQLELANKGKQLTWIFVGMGLIAPGTILDLETMSASPSNSAKMMWKNILENEYMRETPIEKIEPTVEKVVNLNGLIKRGCHSEDYPT